LAPDTRSPHPAGTVRALTLPAGLAALAALAVTTLAGVAALAGCGQSARPRTPTAPLPTSYIPLAVGPTAAYRPPAGDRPAGEAVAALGCSDPLGPRVGVHVELLANRHVVLIPPGIGVADPIRTGPSVTDARCYAALVTLDPTGVVEIRPRTGTPTLATFFALWGQPLSSTRLAGFTGHQVHVFVDGRPVTGDPAEIRLHRHDEVVLEIGGYVVPHQAYGFAHGL
jgi:hypothetical protein